MNAALKVPVKNEAASRPGLFFGMPLESSQIMSTAPRMVGMTQISITL
jgi:hypothetical protein